MAGTRYMCLVAVTIILTTVTAKELIRARTVLNSNDDRQHRDCNHLRESGYKESGVYVLWMNTTASFKIYCEHGPNNSYTVIQRRMYGNEQFARTWSEYVSGFGNPQYDFWIGLNNIYYLTTTGNTVLTVNAQDWYGNNRKARYQHFKLADSSYDYTLSIGGYSGDITDDLSFNNGMRFATYDKPDPNNCAYNQRGGWWYNYCTLALPNGEYYKGGPYTPQPGRFYDGIYWKDWMGYGYSLKFITLVLSNS